MSKPQILSGTIPAPARLDKALAEATDLSRARVQALIADGMVEIDGTYAGSPSSKVAAGAKFRITVPAAADDNDIVFRLWFRIAPVRPPALVASQPFFQNPEPGKPHLLTYSRNARGPIRDGAVACAGIEPDRPSTSNGSRRAPRGFSTGTCLCATRSVVFATEVAAWSVRR